MKKHVDGLSVRFLANSRPYVCNDLGYGSWRFNLRESNTEPLLRLNVESVGNEDILIEHTTRISEKLESAGGKRETKFHWKLKIKFKHKYDLLTFKILGIVDRIKKINP